jgi:hypothetical protein
VRRLLLAERLLVAVAACGRGEAGGERTVTIAIDTAQRFQAVHGFGAALTDASAWLLHTRLAPDQRRALLRELFGRDGGGIGLSAVLPVLHEVRAVNPALVVVARPSPSWAGWRSAAPGASPATPSTRWGSPTRRTSRRCSCGSCATASARARPGARR